MLKGSSQLNPKYVFIVDAIGSLKGFDFDGSEYLTLELSKENNLCEDSLFLH